MDSPKTQRKCLFLWSPFKLEHKNWTLSGVCNGSFGSFWHPKKYLALYFWHFHFGTSVTVFANVWCNMLKKDFQIASWFKMERDTVMPHMETQFKWKSHIMRLSEELRQFRLDPDILKLFLNDLETILRSQELAYMIPISRKSLGST